MKLLQRRIQEAARRSGVNQLVVERDYAQSYVLLGIASQPVLERTLVFKGGTALKKIYFEGYRFSEDLDFSSLHSPTGAALEQVISAAVEAAQVAARVFAPVNMTVERYEERDPHPGGQEAFVVRVQFPWHRQPSVPIKIEVTHDELVLLPTPAMPVLHAYDELLPAAVRTYSLEEVCAEKLRSTRQTHAKLIARGWARPRARDFFDLWHLLRLDPGLERLLATVGDDLEHCGCGGRDRPQGARHARLEPTRPVRVLDVRLANAVPHDLDGRLDGGAHAGFDGADSAGRDAYACHVAQQLGCLAPAQVLDAGEQCHEGHQSRAERRGWLLVMHRARRVPATTPHGASAKLRRVDLDRRHLGDLEAHGISIQHFGQRLCAAITMSREQVNEPVDLLGR